MEYIVSVEKKEDADEIERTYSCERLVRCKDCKYWEHTPNNTTSFWKPCDEIKTEPHYYCWCGVAKDGEQE